MSFWLSWKFLLRGWEFWIIYLKLKELKILAYSRGIKQLMELGTLTN